jgi:hypothetical protein
VLDSGFYERKRNVFQFVAFVESKDETKMREIWAYQGVYHKSSCCRAGKIVMNVDQKIPLEPLTTISCSGLRLDQVFAQVQTMCKVQLWFMGYELSCSGLRKEGGGVDFGAEERGRCRFEAMVFRTYSGTEERSQSRLVCQGTYFLKNSSPGLRKVTGEQATVVMSGSWMKVGE